MKVSYPIKCGLVGHPAVGKTSLGIAYSTEKFVVKNP